MAVSKKRPTKRQAEKQAILKAKAERPEKQGVRPNPWPEGAVLIYIEPKDEAIFFTGQALNVHFGHGDLVGRVELKLMSTERV